ncbi:unnamed protein product, partial [Lymnaea stagnalis]
LVDDATLGVVIIVQYCVISSVINVCGMVTNFINIAVFIKMGFAEVINISLLSLSVADLGSLVALQFFNICISPWMQTADIPFEAFEVAYLAGGWPRMYTVRVVAWVTAFITFERCLCIAMPLKVKLILTPIRTVYILIFIFVFIAAALSASFITTTLVWKFFPGKNKTLVGIGVTANRKEVDSIAFVVNDIFLPISAYVSVVVCTVVLTVKLSSKAKWRQQSTTKSDHVTGKEKQVMKLVNVISGLFIASYFPNAVVFFWMAREPEFNIDGKYRNIFMVCFSYCFIAESLNSCVNIVVYYKMSSKFKSVFNTMFRLDPS